MNIGKVIASIRDEQNMTQEEFGKIFHVTRQTVSNWENEKSYPDLQVLVDMSDIFKISLDRLIKEDEEMIKIMDKERLVGKMKREKTIIDGFTGAGTGIIFSCLFSTDSYIRTICILIAITLIGIGWYKMSKYDKKIFKYMDVQE